MKPILYLLPLFLNLTLFAEPEEKKTTYDDFNFDGHLDKMVFASRGSGRGGSNEFFEISLYNPETKSYELHDALSELCNPSADADKKEIHTAARGGTMGGEHCVYIWKGKELILIERVTSKDTYDDKGFHLIVVTEKLIDGKLTVVSKEREEVEGQ